MQEIQFIAPAALHDEMLRLRNEKQMDFLESLTGMDWGVADEKDAPEKLRGLGVVYHLESTITGERIALKQRQPTASYRKFRLSATSGR